MSTTMLMVRLLSGLLRMPEVGKYIVPIVPDEARTFGMDGLFKVAGIYSPQGQMYRPVDADTLVPYREAADGQILQEGICETGAMASFMAAGSAYAVHGLPMVPFYIFYSMFGFQRVGDMIWSCGDMKCRGFLLGGTAGRTTLNGEGLQHEDGHSHILASTIPNLLSYDPAFAFELTYIVQDGMYRMYECQEDVFYYLTLYNENVLMPDVGVVAEATGQNVEQIRQGVLAGGYRYQQHLQSADAPTVHLLGSGAIMQQALKACDFLIEQNLNVVVWSITSFSELEREAQDCDRHNRLNPLDTPRQSAISRMFGDESGVFVAATDYMKKIPGGLAKWMPEHYEVLGTDGYGLSEARPELRAHFEVDHHHISQAALSSLYRAEMVDGQWLESCLSKLEVDPEKTDPRLR